MAQETVVKDFLSNEMISAGEELTRRLDKVQFEVTSSFWLYDPDSNVWRMTIANPQVEADGPARAYKKVQSVISRMPEDQPKIHLKDITVIDSKDPLISLLRKVVRTGKGISGHRFSRNAINGVWFEDAYIYRIM